MSFANRWTTPAGAGPGTANSTSKSSYTSPPTSLFPTPATLRLWLNICTHPSIPLQPTSRTSRSTSTAGSNSTTSIYGQRTGLYPLSYVFSSLLFYSPISIVHLHIQIDGDYSFQPAGLAANFVDISTTNRPVWGKINWTDHGTPLSIRTTNNNLGFDIGVIVQDPYEGREPAEVILEASHWYAIPTLRYTPHTKKAVFVRDTGTSTQHSAS